MPYMEALADFFFWFLSTRNKGLSFNFQINHVFEIRCLLYILKTYFEDCIIVKIFFFFCNKWRDSLSFLCSCDKVQVLKEWLTCGWCFFKLQLFLLKLCIILWKHFFKVHWSLLMLEQRMKTDQKPFLGNLQNLEQRFVKTILDLKTICYYTKS